MSKVVNDGGPAFMVPPQTRDSDGAWYDAAHSGMTLRDYFAAAALNSLPDDARHTDGGIDLAIKATAQWAYRVADAMISERSREVA